ncbi:DUF3800 domain-containing protein [Kitasatospora sp. NPDC127060]|uniref:DUF3800 domain-containing protein n=1 Tax=Kitasatospora sp. NPDC127060 TaxID=3347121 RepID=UPI00365C4CC5
MRLIFIDDSRQMDCPRERVGDLIALGGVSVPEKSVLPFAEDLQRIKKDLGIPADEEIKWKPAKKSFLATAGGDLVKDLRRRMLQAAIDRDIRSMVVILDHSRAYTGCTVEEAGREILKWLYERISMHLGDHDDVGIVFADKPGGGSAQEGKWLASTLALTDNGTEYIAPGKVVLPIVTAPSHHVPHLQLADLVVAASTAAVAGRQSAVDLKDLLYPLAHKRSTGSINGAGVVIYPDRPNLYYRAFGEETYWRGWVGFGLPDKQFDYFDNVGLKPSASQP